VPRHDQGPPLALALAQAGGMMRWLKPVGKNTSLVKIANIISGLPFKIDLLAGE
jgi:hypothetical protein